MKRQLELDLRAKILVFPVARCLAEVRQVARRLDAIRDVAEAKAYWRGVVADLDRRLSSHGLTRDQINVELWGFFDAVQMEMLRQYGGGTPQKGQTK
ncbi:DUF6074 family protein [Mesorhizobium sp. ORS 3428]|uniref:DUF6074 family protein n=1 Tax=Mesorhizobium sp. ORS 3428 TaxID=540997 RepID=UPI0008DA73A1|nr:DUF6074 family protein [Mesorhizobium sp. ORS 3428]OHV87922.1 hypothetical protein ORS3428_03855 [Mesorhizobium sp. ORS 3428]